MIRRALKSAARPLGIAPRLRRSYFEIDQFKVDEFHGREAEIKRLQAIFENTPSTSMYLLHGPPNCGKTRLVRHYLDHSNAPYVAFDLRGNRLTTADDLLQGLNKIADAAMDTDYLTQLMSKTATKRKLSYSELKLATEFKDIVSDAEGKIREAKDTLTKIRLAADAYDRLSFYVEGRSRALLFFLDEVGRIREIVPSQEESTQAFRDLMSCFIKITKQERLSNVLMATTDPLYNLFLHELGFQQDYFYKMTMGNTSCGES